jgi:hypothetical protein
VPIVLRYNNMLDLNRAEYSGAITYAELIAVAEHQAEHPESLKRDCLSIVLPGAEFCGVDFAALDALFDRYTGLFARFDPHIFRRAAWLCLSTRAKAHIDYWLGQDTRAGMSSLVRQFSTFDECGEWLVLNPAERLIAERGEGFSDVARFVEEPARASA